jgi:hypothetical protein
LLASTSAALSSARANASLAIDEHGAEQDEKNSLLAFLDYMKRFDVETDEIVGHNIIGFDLPFIFQRCLVHCISATPLVDLGEYRVQGVFDTMLAWWFGSEAFCKSR